MAFQPPAARQEIQNRKILEELQQQKKNLLLKTTQPPPSAPSASTAPLSAVAMTDAHVLAVNQRTALQHAHAHSVGYFITQDSSFGNLILPVLPRLENIPTK